MGPFPKDAVRGMLESGTVQPSDYAWGEGMAEWATLDSLFPGVMAQPAEAPAPGPAVQANGPAEKGPGFGSVVSDAMSYPFRGDGVIILVLGTLVFTVLNFIGIFSLYISLASWGYLLLMLQQIVQASAQGETKPPSWPEFDGMGELLLKAFQWLVVLVVCFGPGGFLMISGMRNENPGLVAFGGLLFLLGAVYMPMGLLGVAMFDSVAALNPMLVARSIFRIPGHYFLCLATLVLLGVVKAVTGKLGDLPGAVGIVGHVVDEFDALWSSFFFARLLGGLYHINRRRLGWF